MDDLHGNLAQNIRRLREAHGLSQQRMAQLSGIPRPTWASLESGTANPTLSVLNKAASALQVSIEELVGPPRTEVQHFKASQITERKRQGARIRPLVPEALAGLEITRMAIKPGVEWSGFPILPEPVNTSPAKKAKWNCLCRAKAGSWKKGTCWSFAATKSMSI